MNLSSGKVLYRLSLYDCQESIPIHFTSKFFLTYFLSRIRSFECIESLEMLFGMWPRECDMLDVYDSFCVMKEEGEMRIKAEARKEDPEIVHFHH